ncbi:hypothetical protein F5887DRAFT_1012383 [Amanita rubescens]|nr:hypothetical protein F5887DRAFT_1012383 [Amanita rubescens]
MNCATRTRHHSQFPPHVVLHPDDASNRVFLAIARALLSIDNRAMTIKDLAEMSVKCGLACQNVSAASQAITSYIRTHLQRCEAQQDHPLLLRHVLSGTDLDDDLLPALYSRSGGAHYSTAPDNRVTNFRRGTMVWYLSRATGAPCPFARAGIKLFDFTESDKFDIPSTNVIDDSRGTVQSLRGQKRKRAARDNYSTRSSYPNSDNEDQRPFKIKLTLRLPLPLTSSFPAVLPGTAGSANVNVIDIASDSSDDSDGDTMSDISALSHSDSNRDDTRLSPLSSRLSVPDVRCPSPYSSGVSSPPPDSEDEDDDYHISMTGIHHYMPHRSYSPDLDTEWKDLDSDAETDTLWEGHGLKSPSPLMMSDTIERQVKREPHDVQGMLDAWDDLDNSIADVKVVEVLTKAAAGFLGPDQPGNAWHFENYLSQDEWQHWHEEPDLRDENFDIDTLFHVAARITPITAHSPASYEAQADLKLSAKLPASRNANCPLTSLIENLSVNTANSVISPSPLVLPPSNCISPQETRCNGFAPSIVVVHTCRPTSPPICATQVEDISVYQMILGSMIFLRRIDTDFVNLTPILHYAGATFPNLNSITNLTIISKGSPIVSGTWVPLTTAQSYIQEHPVPGDVLNTFLSDKLHEEFPQALQDFHLSNTPGRMLNQFGRHFGSTLEAMESERTRSAEPTPSAKPDTESVLSMDSPLSASEQEMFQALCNIPDESGGECKAEEKARPVRRSERVAAARRQGRRSR